MLSPVIRAHRSGDEFDRGVGIDSPMRGQQRTGLDVDRGAGETGWRFGIGGLARRRIAV